MSDRQILFSGEMVRALLEGGKTMTRRVFRPEPPDDFKACRWNHDERMWSWTGPGPKWVGSRYAVPRHTPGDRLWVREAWAQVTDVDRKPQSGRCLYRADASDNSGVRWPTVQPGDPDREVTWRPSIHMPRWASRLTLIVTDVRVERVQDISAGDCLEEGVKPIIGPNARSARDQFQSLWNSLNAKRGYGWDENPWVAATSFHCIQENIDDLPHHGGDGHE
ncbi:MAG: hypothetical protein AAGC82_09980 [Pseudomonadota bacterium]